MNWQKTILAIVAMATFGVIVSVFAFKGLLSPVEAKAVIGSLVFLLVPSPAQALFAGKAASIIAGHDVILPPQDPPSTGGFGGPPGTLPPAVKLSPLEFPTTPRLLERLRGPVLACCLAVIIAPAMMQTVAGCGDAKGAADQAEHGLEHTVGLAKCQQQARQAATDAVSHMPSDAGQDAEAHTRRVVAFETFDRCTNEMKDGGI